MIGESSVILLHPALHSAGLSKAMQKGVSKITGLSPTASCLSDDRRVAVVAEADLERGIVEGPCVVRDAQIWGAD